MSTFQRYAPAVDKPKRQPSKQAKQRVRDAFDPAMLAHICTTWDFTDYAQRVNLEPGGPLGNRERFYYYQDNGSDVLAIAHLDSVQDDGTCVVTDTAAGLLALSGTLDDRLGAYVILELLPKLGITCDWLLTTDEEIGQSTAEEFYPEHKDYNWMFQFDRGGTDVVMYEYETPELVDMVEDCGARVGDGSFSDICLLEHLGVAGFNWGVGYADYHGPRAHAWLEDTFRMVARFVKFYKVNADNVLTHVPRDRYASVWGSASVVWGAVILGDCGHNIDLDDENTYVEVDDQLWCPGCGAMPDFTPVTPDDLERTA